VKVFERLFFAQQDLKHSVAELAQVNKQLEHFVHIVSHDLKSPLATVVTLLSIIRSDEAVVSNPALQDKVDTVFLNASTLGDMINAILEYSKISYAQQKLETVDTYELANQVCFALNPPSHMKVVVHEYLPTISTRRQKLQQVFQNLISNAIKYNDKPEGLIEVCGYDKEDFYVFAIKDNGPGIAKEDTMKIFRLFETAGHATNKDTSTGIGLNIMKMLVAEQGGKIWVESNPGVGSTFFFEWKKK
jgi:signal transduction histidine kinase